MSSLKKSASSAVIGRRLRQVLGGLLTAGFGVAWWSFVPPAKAAPAIVAPPPRVERAHEPSPVAVPASMPVVPLTEALIAAVTTPPPTPAKRKHHRRKPRPPIQVPVGDPPMGDPPVVVPVALPVVEPVVEPVTQPETEPAVEPPTDEPIDFPPITTRSS